MMKGCLKAGKKSKRGWQNHPLSFFRKSAKLCTLFDQE